MNKGARSCQQFWTFSLSFEKKKAVAAQFIRRVEAGENFAEIVWNAEATESV